jgi:fructuronate reductase
MVDRIVPATTDAHREAAAGELGLADRVPVPAEPFSMWVLQDDFAAGRPAWESAGAVFTPDVHAYELLKLRLLNGTHSLIAYLGLLAGYRYIADAVRDPAIERAARAVMLDEYLPTLRVPDGMDAGQYTRQLFDRFGNSAIGHLSATVGSDGSLKLPVRITEPAHHHLGRGRVPRFLALTVAAYLGCAAVADGYDAASLGAISDPALDLLAPLGARHDDPDRLVRAVFAETGVFEAELAGRADFTAAVAELLGVLRRHGVAAAVSAAGG